MIPSLADQLASFKRIIDYGEKTQQPPLPGDDARRVALELAEEVERLRKALEWYAADQYSYRAVDPDQLRREGFSRAFRPIDSDSGAIARQALESTRLDQPTEKEEV